MHPDVPAAPRPRRLLSIDGGGLLGLIPAEALIAVEKQLDQITGKPEPLCNRFDLIGGTSTGSILAAGLALGKSATQLRDFYLQFGHEIFSKSFLPVRFWHSYPSGPLEDRLKEVLGESTTLGSDKLLTQIMIVAKNATLGNDWFFTNNPKGQFFQQNSALPLWELVRSSSAAPTYFPPHTMSIPDASGNLQKYEFIDGGVSSYNNPSLQVFLEATIPDYGNAWPMGTDQLLLLSLGTGFNAVTIPAGKAAHYELIDWGRYAVKELMNEANLQQNVLMHLIGQRPGPVPSAMAELVGSGAASGVPNDDALTRLSRNMGMQKLVTYQRVTVGLTKPRLQQLGLGDIDPEKVREMDAADQILNMQRVGQAVAKEQVHMELLKNFFTDPAPAH
jgi:hypothetical protein